MKVSSEGNKLSIVLESSHEWEDIFEMNDGAYVDILIDSKTIGAFFPDWRNEAKENDVFGSLNYEYPQNFETLNIKFDFSIDDRSGEGDYIIEEIEFEELNDDEGMPMTFTLDDFEDAMMVTVYFTRKADPDIKD